ncbi:MAG: flagellar basal body L-ring protein FlgH [Nitrospirae bacterium]|nr:flagellar basal body L-ring protein FlgH [Nitrospirota bacterium]
MIKTDERSQSPYATRPGRKSEVRTQMSEKGSHFLLYTFLCGLCILASCASTPQLPPHPPKYVYKEEPRTQISANSLWNDSAGLYEDSKARRLNDLVTIKVVENITGSGKADTTASRDSSLEAGVDSVFGVKPDIKGIDFFGKSKTFSPGFKGSMKDDFKGNGETTREGKLIGTITAKVVEVMPNGNLVLESRKDITINNEKQILVLRGMIRPDDIATGNTVLSSKIADAEVFYVGDGVIQDKQAQGWLVRALDRVWPF